MLEQNSLEAYLEKPRGDKVVRLNLSRNTLIAFVVSIVLHLLVFMIFVPKIDLSPPSSSTTIEVSLAPQPKAPEPAPEPIPIPPQPEVKPEPKIIAKKPTSKPSKPQPKDFSVPKVLTQESNEKSLPTPSLQPQPQPPADVPTDMASYIAQQRAKRESAEQDAARQNAAAAAAEMGLTEEQKRDERIKRNFQGGTRTFEITSIDNRNATFTFSGWQNSNSKQREYFEVEASADQDIHQLIIRRIISRIREDFTGDFNWKSHRLGRIIVLSARLEDSAELEDFLMQEFFGTHYKSQDKLRY